MSRVRIATALRGDRLAQFYAVYLWTRRRHVAGDYVRSAPIATKFVRQRSMSRWASSCH